MASDAMAAVAVFLPFFHNHKYKMNPVREIQYKIGCAMGSSGSVWLSEAVTNVLQFILQD